MDQRQVYTQIFKLGEGVGFHSVIDGGITDTIFGEGPQEIDVVGMIVNGTTHDTEWTHISASSYFNFGAIITSPVTQGQQFTLLFKLKRIES